MIKKVIACLLAAGMLALAGCGKASKGSVDTAGDASKKLSIVCTIFPCYDWVRQILGSDAKNADLTMLLDNGVDLHNYQPTADDIIKISDCDLFIYVGGASDTWVADALSEAVNKNMVVLNLMDILGGAVREEEVVEGMQQEAEEDSAGGIEYDEHVWLSLKNASVICGAIKDALCRLDAGQKDAYPKNSDDYIAQLKDLDRKYTDMVKGAARDTVLFADRFPFRYLADDYGLSYYAAFVGCSAETEASFETVIFLAKKADELALPAVLVIENSDQKIAKAVISNTAEKDQNILVLDSMQSVTGKDASDGKTYLAIMQNNLDVLRTALN